MRWHAHVACQTGYAGNVLVLCAKIAVGASRAMMHARSQRGSMALLDARLIAINKRLRLGIFSSATRRAVPTESLPLLGCAFADS